MAFAPSPNHPAGARAGAGTLWLMKGGVLQARALDDGTQAGDATFRFVQISDSHIGSNKAPNLDVAATLQAALACINSQAAHPDFVLHTGDLTHLSRTEEFDVVGELMRGVRTSRVFYVPGEHDVIGDNGTEFFRRSDGSARKPIRAAGTVSITAVCISLPWTPF